MSDLIIRNLTIDDRAEPELDELIATNASVHLECMSDEHWWMSVKVGDREVHVNFSAPEGVLLTAQVEEQ